MFSSKNPAGEKAPSKQGFLLKRGEKGLKQMKQRWFALEMNTLSYYKNNRLNSAPLGFISLSQVTSAAPSKKDEEGTFEIKMENEGDKEGRTYVLRARTTSEMEEWIAVINESKAYYERGGLASSGASSVESAEGNLKLQLQHKEREIEALARSLKLTKDLLEKEKRRCALILETERAEANKIRDAQKELAAEASSLKAQIADKEKQLAAFKEVMDKSDSKEDQLRVHTLTISKKPEDDLKEELECRTEELKEVKQKVKEKKERIRDLRKQLATANEVFNITKVKSGGSAMDSENSFTRSVSATTNSLSDSDSVFLLREKMSEMKETLDRRIEELQEKLEGQIAENHKLESDAAQWKGMAQKELKARLNLETEKASLQRELNESRRNLDSYRDSGRSKSSSSSREGSSRDNSSNEYVVPDYSRSPKASSGYHPLIEEGSAADPSSRGGGKATNNPNCWSCSIQ